MAFVKNKLYKVSSNQIYIMLIQKKLLKEDHQQYLVGLTGF